MCVFSSTKFLCCLYHSESAWVNTTSVVLESVSVSARSSCPGIVSGDLVSHFVTVFIWWKMHICMGIPWNTVVKPRLPSITTAVNIHPCDSSICLPYRYVVMRSLVTSLHHRFFLSVGDLNTQTPYDRPQKVVSTTRMVVCGVSGMCRDGVCWSRYFCIVGTERWYATASCISVCFPHTYARHSCSRNICGRRSDWNCLWHSVHLYRRTPRRIPFFLTYKLRQNGHFFKTHGIKIWFYVANTT